MNRAKTNDLDQRRDRLCEVYRSPHFIRDATAIAEQLASHLTQAAARQRTVWPAVDPDALLQRWPDPEQGPQVELPSLIADIIADSTCQHHPGFVGQQLSVPPPLLGAVAMVSAILNNSAAIFEGAPVAIALEQRIVSWMAQGRSGRLGRRRVDVRRYAGSPDGVAGHATVAGRRRSVG